MADILLAWPRDAEMKATACCFQEAHIPGKEAHTLVAGLTAVGKVVCVGRAGRGWGKELLSGPVGGQGDSQR